MFQKLHQTLLDGAHWVPFCLFLGPLNHGTNSSQDEDGNHKLPPEEVATIKSELIGLMIASPPKIQSQLGDAISVIAESDFWRQWDTLVDVSRAAHIAGTRLT